MKVTRRNSARIGVGIASALAFSFCAQVTPAYAASDSVSFTRQAQQNGSYCGPAAVRAALSVTDSTPPSQATLAGELGTTSSVGTPYSTIAGVLNRRQSRNDYLTSTVTSGATIMANAKLSITRHSSVAILSVNTSGLPWSNGGTGHYIVIYGYNDSTGNLSVWDPNNGNHTLSASQAYRASSAHNSKMIW
ncbi:C39 family peptidase [Streptomyces europaeiscabiei]|uniref:C39 family peptidase n=1 Tax=Streptomyces europaeiscabiei TaxID=146819 RepID=UPI0029C03F6C|nr:C39 family peptidase [Streptomyces europaeiscabiei]